MVATTTFSRDDLLNLLSHYELGDFQGSQELMDTTQTNHIIESSQATYFLKYYENRSFESVSFEANLLNYILRRNFPCPRPIKKQDGTYVGMYQDKPFMLFEFIEGQAIEHPNREQRQKIIKTAASLQSYTKNYRPQNKRYRLNYQPPVCRRLAQEKAERLDTRSSAAIFRWFDHQINSLDIHRSLPKGICHCDYHYSNFFFRGDDLIAFVDFDTANFTLLAFDLALLIHKWAWTDEAGLNVPEARQIIADYELGRSLMTIEKNHFYGVHKLQILFDALWNFLDGKEHLSQWKAIHYLEGMGSEEYYQALFGEIPTAEE